jgi:hypothetical protein
MNLKRKNLLIYKTKKSKTLVIYNIASNLRTKRNVLQLPLSRDLGYEIANTP